MIPRRLLSPQALRSISLINIRLFVSVVVAVVLLRKVGPVVPEIPASSPCFLRFLFLQPVDF